MTYQEWEAKQEISPVSPEAWYAEVAWNAAVEQCSQIAQCTLNSDGPIVNSMKELQTEMVT